MLYALLVAAIVIFIAEQGDETQILAFALATKPKAWQVLLGSFFINVVVLFLFALLGRLIGSFLPEFWLWVVSGAAFIVFGAFALLSKDEGTEVADGRFGASGPVLTTAGSSSPPRSVARPSSPAQLYPPPRRAWSLGALRLPLFSHRLPRFGAPFLARGAAPTSPFTGDVCRLALPG